MLRTSLGGSGPLMCRETPGWAGAGRPIVWKSVSSVQPWLHVPHSLGSPGPTGQTRCQQLTTALLAGRLGTWGGQAGTAKEQVTGASGEELLTVQRAVHKSTTDPGESGPRGGRGCSTGRPADPTPRDVHGASERGPWSPSQAHQVRDPGGPHLRLAGPQRLPGAAAGPEHWPAVRAGHRSHSSAPHGN